MHIIAGDSPCEGNHESQSQEVMEFLCGLMDNVDTQFGCLLYILNHYMHCNQ